MNTDLRYLIVQPQKSHIQFVAAVETDAYALETVKDFRGGSGKG